jgi:hypothetical protein
VLGVPELADDPRFARNEDRTANRDELRPLLVERLQTRPPWSGSRRSSRAGVPCGPINTVDGGFGLARRASALDPVVHVGEGERRPVHSRRATPDRRSRDTVRYDRTPPALDEHGAEIRALAGRRASDERCEFPTLCSGTSTADEIRLLGQDLTGRPDGQESASASWAFCAGGRCDPARLLRRSASSRRCVVALADPSAFTPDGDRRPPHVPLARPTR